ncbi:sugar transferase [Kineococcus glutinatus]|uniref:Sugar transferase n=1 Tax=Kineococcus glutinatus TaxID=1070872 RepID=A0ABP9HLY3_9ACTN
MSAESAEEVKTLPVQRRSSTRTAGPADGPFLLPRTRGVRGRVSPRGRARASARRPAWQREYVLTIAAGDAAAALLGALAGYLARFGGESLSAQGAAGTSVAWTMVLLPPVWVFAMVLSRSYEPRFLGVGSEEFARVVRAGTAVAAFVGTLSWALSLEIARGFVVVALPVAGLLTLAGRLLARGYLHRRRAQGHCLQTAVVAGHTEQVASLIRQVRRATDHGFVVVGACTPDGRTSPELEALGVPVLGGLDEIAAVVADVDAEVVATLTCPELDGPELRRLGWELEDTRADLVVAPALTDVVGPRVVIRPVSGLPLLHVERPELRGVRHLGKALFDRASALAALVVLSPVLLVVAALVRLDSPGPALFRQQRVGKDGRPFTMYKFRSMVVDAERLLIDLRDNSEGNGLLFKMRRDPRVTRMGSWLRKYSLDELPQLINVVLGDMSLVGPRPPLQVEVDAYGDDMRRRLLVKPGLTGLWQVSGRSDLDLDESVRLDLTYVENWTPTFDVMILAKTVGAVLKSKGAY